MSSETVVELTTTSDNTTLLERLKSLENQLLKVNENNRILEERVTTLQERVDQQDLKIKELMSLSLKESSTVGSSSSTTSNPDSSTPPSSIAATAINLQQLQKSLITPSFTSPNSIASILSSNLNNTNNSSSNNTTCGSPASNSPSINSPSSVNSPSNISQNSTPEISSPVLNSQQTNQQQQSNPQPPNPQQPSQQQPSQQQTPPSPKEISSPILRKFILGGNRAFKKEPSVDQLVYAPPSSPKPSKRTSQNYEEENKGAENDVSISQIMKFQMPELPDKSLQWAIVWEYNAVDEEWTRGVVAVQMEARAFASGSLRLAHKVTIKINPIIYSAHFNCANHNKYEEGKRVNQLKLPKLFGQVDQTYVAKVSKTEVNFERYFEDVKMQMLCKEFGALYNSNHPPKNIDFLSAWVIEVQRPNGQQPLLCGLEMFMEGEFKKNNSNFGGVLSDRNTPQAFSHFTYEASVHNLLVVDIQGVDDHYTDPQIHTKDGLGYGAGNLGDKGIKRFIQTHKCNPICIQLDLPPIGVDLSDSRNITRVLRGTMLLPDLIPDLDKTPNPVIPFPSAIESTELSLISTYSGHMDSITALVVTEDNKTLYSGSADGTIKIWNLENQQCTQTNRAAHHKSITAIRFYNNFYITSSLDQSIKVWDRKTNELVKKLEDHTGEVNSICVASEKNLLFSCSFDKSIRVWDLNTYKCIKVLTAHSKSVKSICVSGKYLFSASNDETIKVWDIDMLVCVYGISDAHEGWITSLALHNSMGIIISGCRDGSVKLWNLETFMAISTLEEFRESITDIMVIGDRFIFITSEDATIRIYDAIDVPNGGSLKCIYKIRSAHRSSIFSLATDGNLLFSGGADNNIKSWQWKNK